MAWIFGSVVFLTIVFLAIRFRAFRVLALVAVGLIAAYFVFDHFSTEDRMRREASAIDPSEVELSGLSLSNSYGMWNLDGLVTNNSPYELRAVHLIIRVHNCPDTVPSGVSDPSGANDPMCPVVGEDRVSAYLSIPSGQQRRLSSYVSLRDMPLLSEHWTWTYSDVETVADLRED